MQFGMPTLIENRTLKENAILCRELGLRFIELNMNFPEYRMDCLEQVSELVGIAEQYRLYYTIHLDENRICCLNSPNPSVLRFYLSQHSLPLLSVQSGHILIRQKPLPVFSQIAKGPGRTFSPRLIPSLSASGIIGAAVTFSVFSGSKSRFRRSS